MTATGVRTAANDDAGFAANQPLPRVRALPVARGDVPVDGRRMGAPDPSQTTPFEGRTPLIGQTLSHYRISAAIGAGGMGEVYRATDTRLGREVAIKLLPAALAGDPERLARFEREARLLAALSHPNVATLHSVEEDQGRRFITMELVEGRTLADVVPPEGLPIDKFLGIAIPIADAVAAAHSKGIVHRDLKPANIMLDSESRVKVLDFGLAKAKDAASDQEEETAVAAGRTRAGQLLGTVAYMSPEQAEGRTVDARSDVFSLGIVLYQMATGRHPFHRPTTVSTLSAILKDEPESAVRIKRSLPPALGEVLERCLQKSPERRYASAAEVRDRLRDIQTALTSGALAARPATVLQALRRPRAAVPLTLALLAVLALSFALYRRSSRARWAREVALPEVERLLDSSAGGGAVWRAYTIGREAERYVPSDPLLQRLRARYANPLTIRSEPAGARVYAKPYSLPDGEWELLGETPIEERSYAAGVLRVRIEKDGYEPLQDLYWNRLFESDKRGYTLRRAGSVPEDMAWVPASGPRLPDAAGEGLHMPGVEHLPARATGDFFVDRYEVTNRAYKRFVQAGGYEKEEYWQEPFVEGARTLTWREAIARFRDRTQRAGPATWEVGDFPEGRGDDPVTGVSWYEAAAYAAFAGKRLPTVYHWDRVALTWASGEIVPLSNLAGTGLRPTGGSKAMNRYGTFDLAGNAREWCRNESSRGGRFILGGGWNDPPYAFNDVYAQSPWDRSETNGFRCVKPADVSPDDRQLEATIALPFRDVRHEPGVSDQTFALFLAQYRYDERPLHAVVEETREDEDYTRQKIAFDAAYGGERMSAYLFLPKAGRPPYQTIVLFPGSNAIHTRSSDAVSPGQNLFVLKSGRALILPIYKSTYERGDGLASDYPDETNNWKDHVVMWGKDLRRSIDYLETRPDVDKQRLAYMGVSWGAAMGPIMMAVEPRFKAGIVVVAGLNLQRALPEVDEIHYAPRVRIPVLMLNGKYDFFFPYETSQRPYFELLGTKPPDKRIVVDEAGHAFPRTDLARESLAWLDRYLGPVEARR